MSDDHAFRWPDEEPAPTGLGPAVRQTVRTALVPLAAAVRVPGAVGPTGRRRLRLRSLLRTRPLPLALAMAVGAASLAWALHGTGEAEPVSAWASRDIRAAATSGPAAPASAAAEAVPAPVRHGRDSGTPAGAAAPAPAIASAPPRTVQWGEPLPPFRHLVEATGASTVGPALPSSPARRTPGYAVSASEYLAGQDALRLARGQAPAVAADSLPGSAAARAERPLLLAGLADALGLSTVQDIADGPSPTGSDVRVWTLAQAAEQALRHSPEVQRARARLAALREAPAPVAEPRWRADLRRLRTAFGGPASSDEGREAAPADGGAVDAAQMALQATLGDVGAEVAHRYLQALQARVVLSLALEHERQLLHLVGLVQARAGTRVDGSGLLDRRADQARQQVLQARQVLRASMDELSARVGVTPQRMLMDVPHPWRAPVDLQAAMDEARLDVGHRDDPAPRRPGPPPHVTGELRAAYAQLQMLHSRHRTLRAELAAERRALGAARARLLADGRSVEALVERYQSVHNRRVELATLMLGDAMNQVRVAQLTGQLPLAVTVADSRR